MDKDLLIKAASLCREAAKSLKTASDNDAYGIVDALIEKGMVQDGERERYTQYLMENPEKLAGARGVVDSLPSRSVDFGEVSSNMVGSGIDAMDAFTYQ